MKKELDKALLISVIKDCIPDLPEGRHKEYCEKLVKEFENKQGRYDHAFTLAFSLTSNDEEANDVKAKDIIEAVLIRLVDLMDEGEDAFQEAVMPPYDTTDEEE